MWNFAITTSFHILSKSPLTPQYAAEAKRNGLLTLSLTQHTQAKWLAVHISGFGNHMTELPTLKVPKCWSNWVLKVFSKLRLCD